jgi:hypothetical protein
MHDGELLFLFSLSFFFLFPGIILLCVRYQACSAVALIFVSLPLLKYLIFLEI